MEKYRCSHCNQYFERSYLYKNRLTSAGNQSYVCRKCNTERCRKYRKTNIGRTNINKAVAKSMKKHSIKQNARILLKYHINAGNIIKKNECEYCGVVPLLSRHLEGHHEDYSKPLEVIWLCKKCHIQADRLLRLHEL